MKNIFKFLFSIGKAKVADAVITTGKQIATCGSNKKNWWVIIGIPLIAIELIVGTIIVVHGINQIRENQEICGCQGYRANDLALALLRNCDESENIPHCNDDECFWEIAGVNKYTGDSMYYCEKCKNHFEMIYAGNGEFEKLTFLDIEEWKERKGF